MNWKKIIKWVLITFAILFVIGLLSNKDKNQDNTLNLGEAEKIADSIDISTPATTSSGSSTPSSTKPISSDIGLTEADLIELEKELNSITTDDLGGLS